MASTCTAQHEQTTSLLDGLNAADEADNDWEFNAPKFKDFTIDSDDDDISHAESWFCDANGENSIYKFQPCCSTNYKPTGRVSESAPSRIPSEALYVEDEEGDSKDGEALQASVLPSEAEEPKSAERPQCPDSVLPSRRNQKTPEAAAANSVKSQTSAEKTKVRDGTINTGAEKGQNNNTNSNQAHSEAKKTQQVSSTTRRAVLTKLLWTQFSKAENVYIYTVMYVCLLAGSRIFEKEICCPHGPTPNLFVFPIVFQTIMFQRGS